MGCPEAMWEEHLQASRKSCCADWQTWLNLAPLTSKLSTETTHYEPKSDEAESYCVYCEVWVPAALDFNTGFLTVQVSVRSTAMTQHHRLSHRRCETLINSQPGMPARLTNQYVSID